jgi:formylglycine-generating enzyme required for sulfatase activity
MRIVTLELFFLFSMLYGCGEFGFLLDSSEPEGLQQYVEGAPLPVMVKVPAGQFQMGCISGKNCNEEEGPVHTVNIRSFEMSVTEVTFEQWDACIADGGCSHIPDDRGWGRGDLPVINVSWDDIQSYLSWLNKKTQSKYRLPSEAEWEYAARANSKTVYSWGDAIGVNKANCGGCGSPWDDKQSSPVGSFEENAFGLYDVHGNVWEWAEDCKNKNYIGAPTDGKSWDTGNCRQSVYRGGSWSSDKVYLRAAYRDFYPHEGRSRFLGFRLAK